MPLGRPCAGRARYVRVKLSGETHEWWVEAKRCFLWHVFLHEHDIDSASLVITWLKAVLGYNHACH